MDGLSPIDSSQAATATKVARQPGPPKLFAVGASPAEDQLPDLPPAEVLDALDQAARVLNELDHKQINLRVSHDPKTNELHVHVRDEAGGAEQEIAPHKLLNVLAGDTTGLGVDAKA